MTRREVVGLLAGAVSEQAVPGQQRGAVTPARAPGASETGIRLHWLDQQPSGLASGVSWGVPFALGTVAKSQTFQLAAAGGEQLPLQHWPLAHWPDGSMKWVGFATVVGAGVNGEFRLTPARAAAVPAGPVLQVRDGRVIEIDTGRLKCSVGKTGANLIESLQIDGREVARAGRLVCTLEDRSAADGRTLRFEDFTSRLTKVTLEQSGPVRAVVKLEGIHQADAGERGWLPFVVRLMFYAGQEQIRLVHTFVFDGDQERDFIRGLGIAFSVPLREQVHNRHVRFGGDGEGVWAEAVQPVTGRRPLRLPGSDANAFAEQLAGKRIPNREDLDPQSQELLKDWAAWDSYKLTQLTADGFSIQKRTNPKSCWLDASWGQRGQGTVFVGDVSGGLGAGLRNIWQSHPASLEVRNARQATAELYVWLWSPDAAAMDLRHYDVVAHGLEASYEDVQPGFSTAHGVGRTSELMLYPTAGLPSHEEHAHQGQLTNHPPLLAVTPAYLQSAKVFGIWSLPDRSTAAKAAVEDRLDAAFALYHKEVEQRHWYGFWNYGDVMHQHDGPRHAWRYDVGGFAWDNTELGTDVWLWYSYLRTGRADMFRMAEAMTRHTSEVDVYHLGRFAGLGSRHNVRHWGCGAKEGRISQAAYRRFYYYLTTDERTGDNMRAVVDADYKLLELDPMRLAAPSKTPNAFPARIRGGPDWLAYVGNWMTEWERTGETKYRDKILAGMDSIAAMPFGFLTGPQQLYGYDPKTGRMSALVEGGLGTYNLATIMGGAEVVFELNELIQHPGWQRAWLQYCRLHTARPPVVTRDNENGGKEGDDARYARPGRLSAYVYRATKNPAFAKRAWEGVHLGTFATTHYAGPTVLEPIDEVTGLSTNSTAQGCLEAIEVLAMCGDAMPG